MVDLSVAVAYDAAVEHLGGLLIRLEFKPCRFIPRVFPANCLVAALL